jgi:hypothetical protein
VRAICPYLLAADGRWRSASPSREHRCTAVDPAAVLAIDKQRRLCLVADHSACATYQFATGQGELVASSDAPRTERVHGASGRDIVRTAPLVLDGGRLPVIPTITADRRLGQAALLGLMGVAFAAIILARLSAPTGGPTGSDLAGGVDPGATPVASAVVGATPGASVDVPAPTLVPTENEPSVDPSAEPPPSEPAASEPPASESPATYKVRRGDTLSGIAAEFGTTVKVLVELNDIKDPGSLRVGQVLKLP